MLDHCCYSAILVDPELRTRGFKIQKCFGFSLSKSRWILSKFDIRPAPWWLWT